MERFPNGPYLSGNPVKPKASVLQKYTKGQLAALKLHWIPAQGRDDNRLGLK